MAVFKNYDIHMADLRWSYFLIMQIKATLNACMNQPTYHNVNVLTFWFIKMKKKISKRGFVIICFVSTLP